MIIPHPFWDEVEPSSKTKKDYKKRYGLDLKKIYLTNDKYLDFMEELFTGKEIKNK